MASSSAWRADIDGLRALAIALVLCYHAFPTLLPGGFIGVDVFFVISGYLITSIVLRELQAGRFSVATFYIRRARRLLPALTVVLLASLVAGWWWLWPEEYARLAAHAASAVAFFINIMLWRESGYFDVAAESKPLLHLWSLSVEEQFYVLYPLLLWLAARWWPRRGLVSAGAVIVCCIVGSFAAGLYLLSRDPVGAFFLPHARFWEPAFGGLLAWWHLRRPDAVQCTGRLGSLLAWGGLALILLPAWRYSADIAFPGWAAAVPVMGTVALMAAGPAAWPNRALLSWRPVVLIGLISYPLYLWHWPLLTFNRLLQDGEPSVLSRLGMVAASVLLAWLTWRYIERPLRFGLAIRPALCAAVGGALSAGVLAAGVWVAQGVPGRLPPPVLAVLGTPYYYAPDYREGTCFLRPEQGPEAFAECPDAWPARGAWLLWGDSHAAHLYPGLRDLPAHDGLTIVQRTASGCPPIEGERHPERPLCPAIHDATWAEIQARPPARVTLAGLWTLYDWRRVADTVRALRALGVPEIELIGPVPQWRNSLPRQLSAAWRADGFGDLPDRLSTGLLAAPFDIDARMAALASELGVAYWSPVQALCAGGGCLTLVGAAPGELVAWDDAHLTAAGSRHVVNAWDTLVRR